MTDPRDKYASRLDPDPSDPSDPDDESDQDGQNDKSAKNDRNPWNAKNVKNAWNPNTFYLPPEYLDQRFGDQYDRLNYLLDRDIKKDRHYKPLVIALGLERLERMEEQEVMDVLERMERLEL